MNDLERTFVPDYFEIVNDGTSRSLRLKQEVVDEQHLRHQKAAARRAKRGKGPRKVLQCPALYTGEISNMYDWVLRLFEAWI